MLAFAAGLLAGLSSLSAISGVAIDNKPLTVNNSVPGNLVLIPSVEWPTVVTHANDAGVAEGSANYSASIPYAGYFNSDVCYDYVYDAVEANRYFSPAAAATNRTCSGGTRWSGNFLNWASIQATDTFRMALTGGYRVGRPADNNGRREIASKTYLEKAESDRYNTGFNQFRRLASGAGSVMPGSFAAVRTRIGGLHNQMWFAGDTSVSLGSDAVVTITDVQVTGGGLSNVIFYNPAVHNLPNSGNNSGTCTAGSINCEAYCSGSGYTLNGNICVRPNRANQTPNYRYIYGNNQVYSVSMRVQVCDGTFDTRTSLCTPYGSYYKPEGLIQRNSKKTRYSVFSYQNRDTDFDGAVMRARQKLVGPVTAAETAGLEKPYPDRTSRLPMDTAEWNLNTGVLIDNPDPTDASSTAIGGTCAVNDTPDGSACSIQYSGVINYINRFGQVGTGKGSGNTNNADTGRWTLKGDGSNEVDNAAELYYTALRYIRGLGNLTAFSTLGSTPLERYRRADGMPVIANWYSASGSGATSWSSNVRASDYDPMLYQCQATVFLGIGDTNTANNGEDQYVETGIGTTLAPFSASTWLGYMKGDGAGGPGANNNRNNIASLAFWAHLSDVRPDVPNTVLSTTPDKKRGQSVGTYWVDVVERNDFKGNATNQYYLATKYGGYAIPADDYDANGNAGRRPDAWWSTTTNWGDNTQTYGAGAPYYRPGNMYFANSGQKMIDGLNAAFQKIADDISGSGSSFASNTTKLEIGARTYQAKYMSNGWGGRLTASDVNTSTGVLTDRWDASDWLGQAAGEPKVNASATLLDYTQRKVLYKNATGSLSNFISNWTGGVLTSPTLVNPAALAVTDNQLKYLLGDRTHERQSTATGSLKQFRNRRGMLGDIINSTPVYVGKPNANLYANDASYASFVSANASRKPAVYVGANDGMLHAFWAPDASDTTNAANAGKELFAFMPTEAMAVLKQSDVSTNKYPYWDPEYDHAFSVDGEMTVADVKDGATWKTILVGTMGRGGTTVFAMDVTNPDSPSLLWEKKKDASTVGQMLGNSLGRPIIAQAASGDWRVFLGNGPNSTNGTSALVILDAMTGADDGSINTGVGTNNGLSPVNVWDGQGATTGSPPDGYFDTVYAGDMDGNLWKFDIGGSGTRLFAAGTSQPITVAPLVSKNPYNPPDTWVFFGTGRYLSMADTSTTANQAVQGWYGIIDRDSLVAKSTLNQSSIIHQDTVGRVIEKVDAAGANGWYIDLQSPAEAAGTASAKGERMVVPNFFQGLALIGTTRYPDSNDPCSPTGKGYTMAIDPFTGGRLGSAFFDINQSGTVGDGGDYQGGDTGTPYSGVGYGSGPNNPIFLGSYMYTSLDNGTYAKMKTSASQSTVKRVSWRELLNGN
ncbi:pilus assembly protein [Pseudoxanthomonas sacheonensis]|uniref:Type IV pilus assembly protein PilY1 n=1 Tax=Pseudoxanthomonas sacheonensis TaxID=443615 RepID=A0ABU1RMS5_9GAMM|nr:PilC/PilY family type IV pilus protein [Pseudoxanthomonas sacheonensis]MDR6840076.1 type IV pilus assembly protein PilY1 [Pseudoxanthomonas sacheonensis]